MILEYLLAVIQYVIINLLNSSIFTAVQIPSIPDDVMARMYDYLDLFYYARSIISFFIPAGAFEFGLSTFLILYFVEKLYPFVMWIIKKIPLAIE